MPIRLTRFNRDHTILFDRSIVGFASCFSFRLVDKLVPVLPKQVYGFFTPACTFGRRSNRFPAHNHVDGVRVQLRKLADSHPTAVGNWDVEFQIMMPIVGGNFLLIDDQAIDHNFNQPFSATLNSGVAAHVDSEYRRPLAVRLTV